MAEPLLRVAGLEVAYGEARALFGVSFALEEGRALAVLGANGAGKTTLAASVAGVVGPSAGTVVLDGTDITRWPSHRVSRRGVSYLPEGRGIFPHLSVLDNLRVLLRSVGAGPARSAALERVFAAFPVLAQRSQQAAGTLSGGEQQMLALARVLAVRPRLVVADELSLGLAPRAMEEVYRALAQARSEGVTMIVVEQYAERALAFADDVLIMRRGTVAWSGPAAEARDELLAGYLGGEG